MNQRKVSARYHLFEDLIWELPGFAALKRTVPIDNLQLYAGYVWAREGAKAPCPVVKARRPTNDSLVSTYGCCYLHDESYLNPQTNNVWRGMYVLNEVENSSFDEMPVSFSFLRHKYADLPR
jgi:hypothetical protein